MGQALQQGGGLGAAAGADAEWPPYVVEAATARAASGTLSLPDDATTEAANDNGATRSDGDATAGAASGTAAAAAHGAWGAAGAGSQPLGRMSTMQELIELRKLNEWRRLLDQIKQEKKRAVGIRQVLSYHTSSDCQCRKASGTAGGRSNLKDCGMDNPLAHHGVNVTLANSFRVDDGLVVNYEGGAAVNNAEGRDRACFDILGFLLVSAPKCVLLPPRAFSNGEGSVEACRDGALVCQRAYVDHLAGQPVAAMPLCMAVDQNTGTRNRGTPVRAEIRNAQFEPLAAEETQADRDRQVVEVMQAHLTITAPHRPNQLPQVVWEELQRLLPPGGLLEFFRRNPEIFEVRLRAGDAPPRIDAFRIKAAPAPPPGLEADPEPVPRPGSSQPASGGSGDGGGQPASGSGQPSGQPASGSGQPANWRTREADDISVGDTVVVRWYQDNYVGIVDAVDGDVLSVRVRHVEAQWEGPWRMGRGDVQKLVA